VRTYVRALLDFSTAIWFWERDHTKVERKNYVLTSAENCPAMGGPAGPVPAPMDFVVAKLVQ